MLDWNLDRATGCNIREIPEFTGTSSKNTKFPKAIPSNSLTWHVTTLNHWNHNNFTWCKLCPICQILLKLKLNINYFFTWGIKEYFLKNHIYLGYIIYLSLSSCQKCMSSLVCSSLARFTYRQKKKCNIWVSSWGTVQHTLRVDYYLYFCVRWKCAVYILGNFKIMETTCISETLVNIYQYTIPYPRVLKWRNTIYKERYTKDWSNLNTSS